MKICRLAWNVSMHCTFSYAHCASLQLSLLKTVFLPCLTQNKTLEQKVKASMETSLHKAFIEHFIIWLSEQHIYSQTFQDAQQHSRMQSCAEWTEQHGTLSCLYKHDGFNSPTETDQLFAFILRSTGAAVIACGRDRASSETRALNALCTRY